ncbi:MAG: hypothetical protein MJB57_17980 [Gemmatimonadetes bacterium]|nr:hypothetical protein [Gemmatimonadota bacterium]
MILTLLLVGVLGLAVLFLIRRPAVDLDLGLALYTVPRGWSFSRINGRNVWERYAERYGAFIRGDKDQSIPLRLWGRLDDASSRAFQMFQFRWVDIEHRTRAGTSGGKSAAHAEAVDVTRSYWGMFIEVPESKTRFRLMEGKSAGFEEKLNFEYAAFDRALNVYCDAADELAVRQFLSPAVLEIGLGLARDFRQVALDFFPGYVLILSGDDFLAGLRDTKIDDETALFDRRLTPGLDRVEAFRRSLSERIDEMRKYND